MELEEAKAAAERDRREAARARSEWQDKATHAAALEARLSAKEAELSQQETAFEAWVRCLFCQFA